MPISDNGLALIRRFEGFSAERYYCPAGVPTIGYGHAIKAGEDFSKTISLAQAENLLRDDVRKAEAAIARHVVVPLTQGQYDALCSFIYNVGVMAFVNSTLKRIINRNWHDEVPTQLARWVYAGDRKLPGLVARREAEGRMYAGEEWG